MSRCVRSFTFILLLILFSIAISEFFVAENSTRLFDFYKYKYNKKYKDKERENRALNNFVDNLNKVTKLNEKSLGPHSMFVVNKYADRNEEKITQHYGVTLKPYYNVRDPATIMRNQKNDTNFFEDIKLYDLDDSEYIYKKYLKKFNKNKSNKTLDNTIRYYRFVKTLVEINDHNFKNKDRKKLDENADVLREPVVYVG